MAQKRERGFAAMNPELQREIASKGGRAAHQRGTAHEWDSTEAAAAGRKGGRASHRQHHVTTPGSAISPPTPQSMQVDQFSSADSNGQSSSQPPPLEPRDQHLSQVQEAGIRHSI